MAVVPPPDVLDALQRWLDGVRAAPAAAPAPTAEGLRWTTRRQWHVTLRFLGDASLRAATEAVTAIAAAPARAELGPGLRRLGRGVLCLPAHGLDDLAEAVAVATARVGRPPERRPFRGHLTLARVRAGRRPPPLGPAGGSDRPGRSAQAPIAGSAAPFIERFAVDEIQLVRSTLRPSGAVHEVVVRHPLRG